MACACCSGHSSAEDKRRYTWYCDPYIGRLTQSGEVYTAADFTTAVPVELWDELRGHHLMVCTPADCVLVRVNDTGYLSAWNVLLDLSPRAFRQLAPLGLGVLDVQVWVYP